MTNKEVINFQKKLMQDYEAVPKEGKIISYFDRDFIVYPGVFWPRFDSMPLIGNYTVNKGETVLDLCTGSGVIAIFSAWKGASKVVGVDINPNAIKSAKENATRHKVEKITDFRLGDMFDPVKEKFDIITANLPFTNKKPKKMIERTMWDKDLYAYKRLIAGLDSHLTENGRCYISQMNEGVYKEILELAEQNGFTHKKIGSLMYPFNKVEYYAFELKRK